STGSRCPPTCPAPRRPSPTRAGTATRGRARTRCTPTSGSSTRSTSRRSPTSTPTRASKTSRPRSRPTRSSRSRSAAPSPRPETMEAMNMDRLRLPLAILIASMLGTAGCASVDEELPRIVFEYILASNVGALAWAMAWRSLVFGLLGVGIGLGVFFGLRKLQAFRLEWEHAKWIRGVTGALYVLAFAGTGAWLGFWKGAAHGAEEMIHEGQLGTEILPIAGDAGSLMIASIYVASEMLDEGDARLDDAQRARLASRVEDFASGGWSMGSDELEARLGGVRVRVVELGADLAQREVYQRYPDLEGTIADDLVPWALDLLGAKLADELIESAIGSSSGKPIAAVFSTL